MGNCRARGRPDRVHPNVRAVLPPTREVPLFRLTSFKLASTVALAATAASFTPPALGQEDTDQRLGTVHFATSCNETAQRRFDRGMRYQHSFWYGQAKEIFEDVLKVDSSCAIAYWAIALSLLSNPHSAP